MKKQQKIDFVEKLKDKLGKAKSIFLADYRGLSSIQITQLRDKIAQENAELKVTKNTLLKRALKETGNWGPSVDQTIKGPTTILLAYEDELSPLKVLANFLKMAGIGQIKVGFLEKKFLKEEEASKLATLPDKLTLRGQVVSYLSSPIYGLVGTLQGNLQNLVFAIDQMKNKRPSS